MPTTSKSPRKGTRRCPGCGRNRAERFFSGNRVDSKCATCTRRRTTSASRNVRLQETYGITEQEYDAILAAQGGVCAITGRKPRGNLDVDHDHALQRKLLAQGVPPDLAARQSVRGLLSRAANRRLLTTVRDDVATLQRAIDYLNAPPARGVLT